MPLNIIVCHNNKRGIGLNNNIPWHSKEDLQYFKKITINGIVIMGANTWNSINIKFPLGLPGRENIVLCRTNRYTNNIRQINSTEQLDNYIYLNKHKNLFIIGGEMLYNSYINKVEKIFTTVIDNDIKCDRFFPLIPESYTLETAKVSGNLEFCVYQNKNTKASKLLYSIG
jgi:dihydrofolate reductase